MDSIPEFRDGFGLRGRVQVVCLVLSKRLQAGTAREFIELGINELTLT